MLYLLVFRNLHNEVSTNIKVFVPHKILQRIRSNFSFEGSSAFVYKVLCFKRYIVKEKQKLKSLVNRTGQRLT